MTANGLRHKWPSYFGYALLLVATGAGLVFCSSAETQQRPRNVTSDRYAVNQAFDGQAFVKDNNFWVYTPSFAETFGMPPEGIDPQLNAHVPYEGDQGFDNGPTIFGYNRDAIAGLTMISPWGTVVHPGTRKGRRSPSDWRHVK